MIELGVTTKAPGDEAPSSGETRLDLDEDSIFFDEKSMELRIPQRGGLDAIFTPSRKDSEVKLEVMGQKFQLPADKWTTAAMVALLALTVMVVCYIVFVQSDPKNVENFGNMFISRGAETEKPTMNEGGAAVGAARAPALSLSARSVASAKTSPVDRVCVCEDE